MHYQMGYSRDEIANMLPFEKDILIGEYNRQKEKETDENNRNSDILSRGFSNMKPRSNSRFKI